MIACVHVRVAMGARRQAGDTHGLLVTGRREPPGAARGGRTPEGATILLRLIRCALYLAAPVGLAVLANALWASPVWSAVAFCAGGGAVSLLVYLRWRPDPARARILNDLAVDILTEDKFLKRSYWDPRPPELDRAMKLLQKAAFKDASWLVPGFNLACCLYYLNLVKSGDLNMAFVVDHASQCPQDPICARILRDGNALAKRVHAAGDAWFRPHEAVDARLFIRSGRPRSDPAREAPPRIGGDDERRSELRELAHSTEKAWKNQVGVTKPSRLGDAKIRRHAEKAAGAAADKVFRDGYEEHFLPKHLRGNLSEEMRLCHEVSREKHLALCHVQSGHLEHAETIFRGMADLAQRTRHHQTRCIAFHVMGDFLFRIRGVRTEAQFWLRKAADELEHLDMTNEFNRNLSQRVRADLDEAIRSGGP